MKKSLAIFAMLFGFSFQANAIFIEPFIGYETGDFTNGTTKGDLTGTTMGLRLGGGTLGLSYGVEYQKGTGETEVGSATADLDTTDIGAFVGFEFPILVRAFATYYFSHEASPQSGSDYEGDGGIKLGVGYTGLPFVVINLEKMTRSYDKQGSATVDIETDSTILSVSIPLP